MNHLLKIGEVSKLYQVSLDTLRYYDKINLLKPAVVKENGYRYYSIEQLDTLDLIQIAKSLNIPLKQMVAHISKGGLSDYQSIILEQQAKIKEKIAELQFLEKSSNKLLDIITEIKEYQSQPKSVREIVGEEEIDIKIYTDSTTNLYNYRSPFKKNTNPLADSQWSILELTNDEIKIIGEGISNEQLNHKTTIQEKKHLKGKYKMIRFFGTHQQIFQFCLNLKDISHPVVIYVRYDFGLASEVIANYQHYVTIYFDEK